MKKALLILDNGESFAGTLVGMPGTTTGEVVFNTAMTGYQEILTDPSYGGQIIVFTFPLIGIYGVNADDDQSRSIFARGLIVSEFSTYMDNWRADRMLQDKLLNCEITGISDVDTRYLTQVIRTAGEMKAIITSELDEAEAKRVLVEAPVLSQEDVVEEVVSPEAHDWKAPDEPRYRVAALDFGIKWSILDYLTERGCACRVFPAKASADEVLEYEPDGVFISNGPGDPERLEFSFDTVRALTEKLPGFGICLGHQVLALAYGLETYKMKFGHRGANHPVRDLRTGRAHITSQNHSYAVALPEGMDAKAAREPFALEGGLVIDKVHINDGTVEGMRHAELPFFSVQYHPEGHPGPEDNLYLFDQFVAMMG
ncbi:glutamine-hydrolyzing carbamoyl-phosphate synthase small subunit [bacterium]|nr:glutamine-hydrolyzing carbamoyl-phosphate synthase small subunit [bacterium]